MPRALQTNKSPIVLKRVIKAANISLNEFCQSIRKETGMALSRTSLQYVLNYGMGLKRIPNFQERVCGAVSKIYGGVLTQLQISPDDLWKQDTLEAIESSEKFIIVNEEDRLYLEKMKKIMEVTMLTKSTLEHFGLKSAPFTLDIKKESDIYLSSSHLYALEVMREAAEYGGFAVITGQVGSGKSTILSKFLEENRINHKYQIIFPEAIDKTRLNAKQILQACILDMSESDACGSMEKLSRQVKELLIKRNDNNDRSVLVIEEAHDLPTDTLKYLKRLWEFKNGLQRLMGIILIGQNELEVRLYGQANTEIREVTARTTHARVEPIDDEITDYITHRVRTVKGDINKIITNSAIAELSQRLNLRDRNGRKQSLAYPLMINNIMNRLMNYCSDSGEEVITPDIVISAGV